MHEARAITDLRAADEEGARLATEIFLRAAGPALVKSVAEILRRFAIPVMPLKGVLLQKLVYRERAYRPITDVDIVVPEARFLDAHAALCAAGFSLSRWEVGGWQVTMRNPDGPPLGIDLHRRLTRTSRSRLTSAALFQRGTPDTELFAAPVVLPQPQDLFAHLLLHASLHWLNLGRLHRPGDFQAVAEALALDPHACAAHLARQGMTAHALLLLPMISEAAGGPFIAELLARIARPMRAVAATAIVEAITRRFAAGHVARRLAGVALAPSVSAAMISALADRLARR